MRKQFTADFAERAVLGAILLDPAQTIGRVIEKLSDAPEPFKNPEHQQVWTAMLALNERSETIHPTTVYIEMQRMGYEPDMRSIGTYFEMPTSDPGYVDQYIDGMIGWRKQHEVENGIKEILSSADDSNIRGMLTDLAERITDKPKPKSLDMRTVLETAPPLQNYIFKGTIPAGGLIGVWSQGGLGKSFVMLQLGVSAAIGRTLLDSFIPERPMRVIYYASEDTAEELHRRIRAITKRYNLYDESTQARLVDNLRIYPRTSFAMASKTKEGVQVGADFRRVEREANEFGANLIIFDPLAHYLNIEENSNVEMAVAMNVFQRLIQPGADRSVILVHHVSKARQDSTDSGSSRGASAFRDAIRSGWGFAALSEDEVKRFNNIEANYVWRYIKIENSKCNWGPRHSKPIFLHREKTGDGVLVEIDLKDEYARMKIQERANRQDEEGGHTVLTREQYYAYLRTPEWKRTAQIVKVLADSRCKVCNSDGPLEAHHRDYRHVGTAREIVDCVALCDECHEKFHGKEEARKSDDEWKPYASREEAAAGIGCVPEDVCGFAPDGEYKGKPTWTSVRKCPRCNSSAIVKLGANDKCRACGLYIVLMAVDTPPIKKERYLGFFHPKSVLRREADELQRDIEAAQRANDSEKARALVVLKVDIEKRIQAIGPA